MISERASFFPPLYIQTHSHTFTLGFVLAVCCVLMGGLNSSRWLFLIASRIYPQGQTATWSEVGGRLLRARRNQLIILRNF